MGIDKIRSMATLVQILVIYSQVTYCCDPPQSSVKIEFYQLVFIYIFDSVASFFLFVNHTNYSNEKKNVIKLMRVLWERRQRAPRATLTTMTMPAIFRWRWQHISSDNTNICPIYSLCVCLRAYVCRVVHAERLSRAHFCLLVYHYVRNRNVSKISRCRRYRWAHTSLAILLAQLTVRRAFSYGCRQRRNSKTELHTTNAIFLIVFMPSNETHAQNIRSDTE